MNLSPVLCFSLVVTSALVPRVPLHAYAPLHSTHTVGLPTVCIFDTQGYCSVPKETYSALFWEGRGTVAPVAWLGRSLSLTLAGSPRVSGCSGHHLPAARWRTLGSPGLGVRSQLWPGTAPTIFTAPAAWKPQPTQLSHQAGRARKCPLPTTESSAECGKSNRLRPGLLTADVPKLASKHSGPRRGLMCLSSCSLQVLSWRRISQVIWLCFILETWAEKIEI